MRRKRVFRPVVLRRGSFHLQITITPRLLSRMPGFVAAQHRTAANKFSKWHEMRIWMDEQTLRSAPMHRVTSYYSVLLNSHV